jgi:pyrroloquinoline quinone (PQQ) biosynthesis protein C
MSDEAWKSAFSAAWKEWRRTEGTTFENRLIGLKNLDDILRMAAANGVSDEAIARMDEFLERAAAELGQWKPPEPPKQQGAPESAPPVTYH